MNKQILQMKYHPAKKEIIFKRFQNGKEVPIRNDSRLRYYMNLKGKFVLQDYGNNFFDDIAKAFDGLKAIDIEVITTKMDFFDFMQMAEYYNETNKVKINPTLLIELPDMNETFKEVIKYGEQATVILKNHRQKIFDIPLDNERVKKSAESFARQIDEEIKNIRDKIDSFTDNTVNLCFTGVYSSGKSALINAILGYKILPENINSETAKMLKISSPKNGENVKIKFDINSEYSELEWNEEEECFEFSNGPSESAIRTEIQKLLNSIKDNKLKIHAQINSILSKLNSKIEISSVIKVLFPIALDSEKVQFTFYDTPGTDSNYNEHKLVLLEALEEQRQSILIFVVKPDALEGSGNNALLNYLKVAEDKNSKTTIDIGRSLFVINKADGQPADERVKLQHQEIKNKSDNDFSIKLADKKLFFTSALYAYAAKAVANGIETKQDIALFNSGKWTLSNEDYPMGYCYRQNRSATSEFATKKMIQDCEDALAEAQKRDDAAEILNICSGLYALETEILQYGEKFASAVKAFAIIDSVNKVLAKLSNKANSLIDRNRDDINEIDANINELSTTINKAIDSRYNEMTIPDKMPLPNDVLKSLKLDKATLFKEIIDKADKYIESKLKGSFFGLGKVKVNQKDMKQVKEEIESIVNDFTNNFLKNRKTLLENQRDYFMKYVKDTIDQNGNISESAKRFFMDIPAPTVNEANKIKHFEEIYNAHKRVDKVLIFKTEYLDKDGFKEDVKKKLMEVTRKMHDDFCDDYREALDKLLLQIGYEFKNNLEKYSLYMQAMKANKDAMISLGKKVSEASNALEKCQVELNKIIWKER
ncbi:MAG: dynamin family protein [Clostridium sp.]|nr:dynamin family protein [Clostridium sp.]